MNFSVFSVIDAIFLVSKEFNEQNTKKKMPFWILMSFYSMAELALFCSRRIYLMKRSGRIWHKYMNALEKNVIFCMQKNQCPFLIMHNCYSV